MSNFHFDSVSKDFYGIRVVKSVTLSIPSGHVLGLVGENGAGKSTMMNMLGGILRPTEGAMTFGGDRYAPASPSDAREAGIAFVHQELNLFDNMSVYDNLFIENFPRNGLPGVVSKRKMREEARGVLERVGLTKSPKATIETLAPGERQLVEIARALLGSPRIIIFDEPTTSLTAPESERLFRIIDDLRASDCSVVYVSHILEDVLRLSDDIAVMRDGSLVGQGPANGFSIDSLIESMIGRRIGSLFPEHEYSGRPGPAALTIDGVSEPGVVEDVSLQIQPGEVVGLFGLMGSGRSELARIASGVDSFSSGRIIIGGVDATKMTSAGRVGIGLGYVPEDRRHEGLFPDASVNENLHVAALPMFRNALRLVNDRRIGERGLEATKPLNIRYASRTAQPVRSLSGGNQQKVVIARWLLTDVKVLILDEPTRGVDVGAKQEIYSAVFQMARHGVGVLLISSEAEEIIGMADRAYVMRSGEIVGSLDKGQLDKRALLSFAFGQFALTQAS